MAEPNVSKLYDKVFKLKELLDDAKNLAEEIAAESQQFGGEISRVMSSQLTKFTIPMLTKYTNDSKTPGAIAPLIKFLDSVPLGLARTQKTEVPEEVKQEKYVRAENGKTYYIGGL